jgi:hypothetical protein
VGPHARSKREAKVEMLPKNSLAATGARVGYFSGVVAMTMT